MASAVIDETASGDHDVIAAPGEGRRISVNHLMYVQDADIVVKFLSGSTEMTGPLKVGANGGIDSACSIACAENEAFKINLSGNAVVGGVVNYSIDHVV